MKTDDELVKWQIKFHIIAMLVFLLVLVAIGYFGGFK